MKVQPGDLRVQKCLTRHLKSPAYRWDDLTDPRDPRGVRRPLAQLLDALLLGLLSGACSLREVEAITEELGGFARQYVPERIPDTTLWDLIQRLFAEELRAKLVQQVRAADRQEALRPEHLRPDRARVRQGLHFCAQRDAAGAFARGQTSALVPRRRRRRNRVGGLPR